MIASAQSEVRSGGTLTVNGGDYTSNGVGSPVIYSTANITVNILININHLQKVQ